LREAIASILHQTFSNFEFIIIDDGSNAKTKKVIKSFKDSRIKLITNKKNVGLTKSLNIGLDTANGKYIARMDSDDVSYPNRLQEQFMYMEKNPSIFLIGCQVSYINESGKLLSIAKPVRFTSNWLIHVTTPFMSQFVHSTFFFRNSMAQECNLYYDEKCKYSQDFEFVMHARNKGLRFSNLNKKLVAYRMNTKSISFQKFKEQQRIAQLIRERYGAHTSHAIAGVIDLARSLRYMKR